MVDEEELARYSKNWRKPAVSKDLAKYDNLEETADTKVELLFQPRGAQIEALFALEDSRKEGAVRGLVQAATGVGKTYLAAFDSAKYKRVLFVAHREFLKASGKGFFIEKERYALAIRDDLQEIIGNEAFRKHMKDILEYRTMEYYRRRYNGE